MIKLMLISIFFLITNIGFAQDSSYYKCSNCSNPLFTSTEIIKEYQQLYVVNFNKADNPFRIDSKEKDVHCTHCDSHTGYTQENSTIKIMQNNVHKNGETYDCSVCKKPLLNEKDLKETTQNTYIFNNVNDEDITIANRSYILIDNQLYCSFCYDNIGKSKKKNKLKIVKKNVIKPQP